MNTPRDHLVKGAAHKLTGVLVKAASPVLTILLAHVFARDVFGQYVSLQLLALTLARFCLLGLDKGIAWYLPQNVRENRPHAHQLGPAFFTALKTGLLVTAGALLVFFLMLRGSSAEAGAISAISPAFAWICMAAVPPLIVIHLLGAALEGAYLPKYRVWLGEFLLYAGIPPIAIALKRVGAGDLSLPLAFLLCATLCAALLLRAAARRFGIAALLPRGSLDRGLRGYAWPQGVSDLVSSVLLRLDLWMILLLLGPEHAAVYAIMLTLSNSVRTIRQSFDSLLLPVISGMDKDARRVNLRPAFNFTVGLVAIIQFFIALAVFFFPGEIMSIAGREYALEPHALLILLAGNLVTGFFGLNAQVLAGLGKSRLLMKINLGILALNFLLNLVWIPRFGLAGAATATVAAYLAQNLLFFVLQIRRSGQHLYSGLLWIQFAWIAGFVVAAFTVYPLVAGASVPERTAGMAAATLVYGTFAFYLRRRTSLRAFGAPTGKAP